MQADTLTLRGGVLPAEFLPGAAALEAETDPVAPDFVRGEVVIRRGRIAVVARRSRRAQGLRST